MIPNNKDPRILLEEIDFMAISKNEITVDYHWDVHLTVNCSRIVYDGNSQYGNWQEIVG